LERRTYLDKVIIVMDKIREERETYDEQVR
jgi:hypothetical protein